MKPNGNIKIVLRYLVVGILMGILAWITGVASVSVHEEAHRAIYTSFNISSSSYINLFTLRGYTVATDGYCSENCKISHNIEESIGFNTASIIFSLWMIFFAYIIQRKLLP